ncbi:MAG TPA: hypothetical protein VGI83_04630 [Gemmatimonadales bacterium]|jgi:hypothetical protein
MKRLSGVLGAAVLALALSTCDGGPTAGELAFDLTTPNTNDGAVQFVATATLPDSIIGVTAACTGCQVFLARVSASNVRGVITGDIGAGALLRLNVTEVGKPELYAVTVVAAASRTFAIQSGAYSLAVEK